MQFLFINEKNLFLSDMEKLRTKRNRHIDTYRQLLAGSDDPMLDYESYVCITLFAESQIRWCLSEGRSRPTIGAGGAVPE